MYRCGYSVRNFHANQRIPLTEVRKSQNIDRMVELGRSTWPEQVAHIREAIKEQYGHALDRRKFT